MKWVDVFYYLQGNFRYWLHRKGLLSKRWKHIFYERWQKADVECKERMECKCGCALPNLLYANKACEGKCYEPEPFFLSRDLNETVIEYLRKINWR